MAWIGGFYDESGMFVSDARIPPGGSIGAGGVILDAGPDSDTCPTPIALDT